MKNYWTTFRNKSENNLQVRKSWFFAGNVEYVSGTIVHDLKRRGLGAKCLAMDDYDFEELPEE